MKRLIKKANTLILYHGTTSDKLDMILDKGLITSDGGFGNGVYLTSDYIIAKKYAFQRATQIFEKYMANDSIELVSPIILEINGQNLDLKPVYNNRYFVSEKIILPKDIINYINLGKDSEWQELLDIYEKIKFGGNDEDNAKFDELFSKFMDS